MNFWKVTTDNVKELAWIYVKQKDLGLIPGERHNEDEIHLKALPEQILVVFYKSRATKEQFHSDPVFILNVLAKY